MEYRLPGYRQKQYRRWNLAKHQPYDYEAQGLLKKCLPEVILNAKNPTTKLVLQFVENSMVFLLKYVDEIKYFKDWNRSQY